MGEDAAAVRDRYRRPLTDLRISVTDRCNFRCTYCMPKEVFGRDFVFMERSELLSFEEIERLARIAVGLGVRKLRLTGGEPLLRRGIEDLVAALAALRTPDGARLDLAMTTNGSALVAKAEALARAGLDRVTVSLDSLDDARFQALNDVRFPVARVLDGLAAAEDAGLGVKVNTVLQRGANEQEILPLAEHFRGTGHTLRFIEYMDVGTTNGWRMEQVVPAAEVVSTIDAVHPLEPVVSSRPHETARRWRYRDGAGEIGVIASVTEPFCGACSRARISADGRLFTCLFATAGTDVRGLMRSGADDARIRDALGQVWHRREDRYSVLRTRGTGATSDQDGAGTVPNTDGDRGGHDGRRIEMSYIGG